MSTEQSIQSTKGGVAVTAADEPSPTTTPATPTVTHYQRLADDFMRNLDAIMTILPDLEEGDPAVAPPGRLNVPFGFLSAAIAGVEQTPALQAVKKLDPAAGRDKLQFIEAFRPLHARVTIFEKVLKFAMSSRQAELTADALQIYAVAKGLARNRGSAALDALVTILKEELGRSGRPKISAKKAVPPPA